MTTTNHLNKTTLTDLQGSDLIRMFSQKYGGDVSLSVSVLNSYIQAQANSVKSGLTSQYSSPSATGFSVAISSGNTWLILTPAAEYAVGTIVLPTGIDGEEIIVNTTQAVTALTVTPSVGDAVISAPTGLAANGYFKLKYDAVLSRWYRIG